jgi:hypothetical protein
MRESVAKRLADGLRTENPQQNPRTALFYRLLMHYGQSVSNTFSGTGVGDKPTGAQ